MNEDRVESLVDNLSHLLDEIGFYVLRAKPYLSFSSKPSSEISILESMIRKQTSLTIDVECFIGKKAWDLSKKSFISPENEMLLMTDLDFFSFLMNLIGEDYETEYSES